MDKGLNNAYCTCEFKNSQGKIIFMLSTFFLFVVFYYWSIIYILMGPDVSDDKETA